MAHKAIRMEVADFADTFLPLPAGVSLEDHPTWATDIFGDLAEGSALLESEIADRFVNAVNNGHVIPGLQMAQSPNKPEIDDVDDFGQKIDAAFYREGDVPTDGRPHWADQLISVEFKRHETNKDPFDDREDRDLDATAEERKKVRGQIITYAEVAFRVQHRTFLFMLLVIGRNFRLLRWDRSGTIVTRAIDYVAHPEVLCELLWRMSLQSDEQLGLDPSATRLRPHDHDYNLMNFYAQECATDLNTRERVLTAEELRMMGDPPIFEYVRASFAHSLAASWPRYRLEVPCGDSVRTFLVCRPVFHANGMAGRGTRGYVALDCQTGKFVWLKDAWRLYYKQLEQEGAVLERLNAKKIAHVPTLLCHGDIKEQTTRTADFWEQAQPAVEQTSLPSSPSQQMSPLSSSATLVADPRFKSTSSRKRSRTDVEIEGSDDPEEDTLRQHMHYRIVVHEVALPLSEFSTGKQLVSIIIDCIEAHQSAFQEGEVMHRDISGGNVLIYPSITPGKNPKEYCVRWSGLLSDWEMSKPTKEVDPLPLPRQPPRTGTWQFLSVGMLSGKPKPVEISDELESFLHVLLYYAVRYLHSTCPDAGEFIESYFDAYIRQNGAFTCGKKKEDTIKDAILEYKRNQPLEFQSPLDMVFGEILRWFKGHYKVVNYNEVQAKTAQMRPPPVPPVEHSKSDTETLLGDATPEDTRAKSDRVAQLKAMVAGKWNRARVVRPLKPSAEEEEDAALLSTHDSMLGILYQAYDSPQWDPEDKVGDRVPDDYEPRFPIAQEKGLSVRTAKRRRTASLVLHRRCHDSDVPLHGRAAKSMFK
ncbi:hypothetical protein FKP32DRAFT_1590361 [Trametes sanguinea]|nr:hypothetical protein FKP32DRAFT_1590361 [Trametes sanguinea]